jgi:hypothetical protein
LQQVQSEQRRQLGADLQMWRILSDECEQGRSEDQVENDQDWYVDFAFGDGRGSDADQSVSEYHDLPLIREYVTETLSRW